MMKLRNLERGDNPGSSGLALYAVKSVHIKEGWKEIIHMQKRQPGHGREEWEEENTSQAMPELPEAGKGEKHSPLEPPEGAQLCRHLDNNPEKPILDFDPIHCERISNNNLNHLFVKEVIRN